MEKNTCDRDRGKMWSVTESVDVSCNTKILQIKIYFLTNEKLGVLLKGIVALISNGYERQRIYLNQMQMEFVLISYFKSHC